MTTSIMMWSTQNFCQVDFKRENGIKEKRGKNEETSTKQFMI